MQLLHDVKRPLMKALIHYSYRDDGAVLADMGLVHIALPIRHVPEQPLKKSWLLPTRHAGSLRRSIAAKADIARRKAV